MSMRWYCRGPYVLPEADRLAGSARQRALIASGDVAGLAAMASALRATLGCEKVGGLTTAQEAETTLTQLLFARRGCGAELTPAVEAAPRDGQTQRATCAQCGNEYAFTPPMADEGAPAALAAHG